MVSVLQWVVKGRPLLATEVNDGSGSCKKMYYRSPTTPQTATDWWLILLHTSKQHRHSVTLNTEC